MTERFKDIVSEGDSIVQRALKHNKLNKKKKKKKLESLSLNQQGFKASYIFEDLLLEDVCNLTRNEPSPRFISNGIHTKIRP